MSKTVDERVVEMRFDNAQFEKNVSTSMSTLDKLKQSLKLDEAAKGLDNVSNAASKFNLSGIGEGVETVKAKFSALEVMAVTALANITNSAVNAGKRLVSSFTIEPIKAGFDEYETQINAVQTILSNTRSKGTNLDQVNAALDELNTYADKTIYNFTEMTRNIGTFTAAGVDLDTSVSAIKGIANLAAVSGSNSQQASTAMYQLSQALSAGTVKLQDWNSVVNAGMGGQVFQDALKETARVHGIKIDEMIEKEGSFRETLKDGWLSSEILTETLSKFTGDLSEAQLESMGYTKEQAKEIMALGEDANNAATKVKTFTQLMDTLKEAAQSGWTQSWEIIVGDFEEAKALWTSVSDYFSDAIGKSAEARNTLLQAWADGGGRDMGIEAIKNAFEGLLNIIKPIKEAFREVFPPTTADQLLKLTEGMKNLSEKFKEFTSANGDKIKSTFKGLFSVIGIGVDFFKELGSGVVKLISNFSGLSSGILGITGSLGDWLSNLRDSIKESDVFGKTIDKIVLFLQNGIDKFKEFGNFIKEKFAMPGFEGFLGIMNTIWIVLQKIGNGIGSIASKIGEGLTNAFRSGDVSSTLDVINGGLFAGILVGIKKFMSSLNDAFGSGSFLNDVKEILGGVKGCLEEWQKDIKANILLKIASAIGILAVSLLIISTIKPEKLIDSLGAITVLFAELVGSMKLMDKFGNGFKGVGKASVAMIAMSTAVFILAGALKMLSDLDISELGVGLSGITALLGELVGVSIIMSKTGTDMAKGSVGLILLAVAIKILASACEDFSTMNWEEIGKGLTGVTVILGELVGASILMSAKSSDMVKGSVGLILLAVAMKILASVCGNFASMNWEEIGKGLTGVTVILGELVGASVLLTKFTSGGQLITAGIGMIAMAAALKIMASACSNFGSMNMTELSKGILGITIALVELVAACVILSQLCGGGQLIAIGIGLIAVSTALNIMASALQNMGEMTWEEIAKGLITLGVSLGILAISLAIMTGTLAGSAALLVASIALSVLAGVLKTLGSMSIGEIFKSLITLAAALALIGFAALVLTPVIPSLLGLGAAISLIGVGAVAFGAGIALIAAAITALAVSVSTGAAAIVAGLAIIITGIANLIPTVVAKIGEAIIIFCQVIADGVGPIGEAIKTVVLTLLDVLVTCIPAIVDAGLAIILALLRGIRDNIGEITLAAIDIIINFINAIAEKLPDIIKAAINLIISFIEGLAKGIEQSFDAICGAVYYLCETIVECFKDFFGIHSPSTLMAEMGGYLIKGLINGIKEKVSSVVSTVKEMAGKLVSSVGDKAKEFTDKGKKLMSNLKSGISNKTSEVKSTVKNVISNTVSIVGSKVGEFLSKGKALMTSLKNGISNGMSEVSSAIKTVLSKAISAVKEKISDFKTIGSNMMDGMKEGIENAASKISEAAKDIAKKAISATKKVLDINSPSKVFRKIGKSVPEGFAQGIDRFGKLVSDSAVNMGQNAIRSTGNVMSRISDSINTDMDTQPTIRPVLDLSDIKAGSGMIGDLLGYNHNVGLMANVNAISSSMNTNQNGGNDDIVSAIKDLKRSINNLSGDTYQINGVTYDDGSNISNAVKSIVRAARVERRV